MRALRQLLARLPQDPRAVAAAAARHHVTRPVTLRKNSELSESARAGGLLHCKDPECLTGCPTGAIGRFPGGQVDINPKTCIGCGDCATQCPYNAISMVPRKAKIGKRGRTAARAGKIEDSLVAARAGTAAAARSNRPTTCSRSNATSAPDTSLNPPGAKRQAYSCEENCPTGALLRVDPATYFAEIGKHRRASSSRTRRSRRAPRLAQGHRASGCAHLVGIALDRWPRSR